MSGTEAWPSAGGQVVISHARGRRLAAKVTSATSLSLRLRIEDRQSPRPSGRVTLEYVAGDRAYRVVGDLDVGAADGQSRFVPRGQPVFLQRRKHMRAEVDVAMVLASEAGVVRLVGRTRNLGTGGALGEFSDVPRVDERMRFSLVSRVGTEVIKGTCRVLRVGGGGEVAVAFEGVTSRQLQQLADFILRHR